MYHFILALKIKILNRKSFLFSIVTWQIKYDYLKNNYTRNILFIVGVVKEIKIKIIVTFFDICITKIFFVIDVIHQFAIYHHHVPTIHLNLCDCDIVICPNTAKMSRVFTDVIYMWNSIAWKQKITYIVELFTFCSWSRSTVFRR